MLKCGMSGGRVKGAAAFPAFICREERLRFLGRVHRLFILSPLPLRTRAEDSRSGHTHSPRAQLGSEGRMKAHLLLLWRNVLSMAIHEMKLNHQNRDWECGSQTRDKYCVGRSWKKMLGQLKYFSATRNL